MRFERDAGPPQRRSTTRAVAWSALLFSVLAFLVSCATLFLCWRDGALAHNAVMLSREVGERWGSARVPSAPAINTAPLKASLERAAELVRAKDASAAYNIDAVREDVEKLRQNVGEQAGSWLATAGEKLARAREDLRENAPRAQATLKAVIDGLPELERLAATAGSALPAMEKAKTAAGEFGEQARQGIGERSQEAREGIESTRERLDALRQRLEPLAGRPAAERTPAQADPANEGSTGEAVIPDDAPLERLKYETPKDGRP